MKLALCRLLFAQIVKLESSNVIDGVPERWPVVLFIISPVGRSGDTSQVRTSPPKTIGCMSSTETLVVRLSSDAG